MNDKIIELLNMSYTQYIHEYNEMIGEQIEALCRPYIAFEAASNPDLIEAQTNYKLYQEQIKKLKEIIQAQDDYISYMLKISEFNPVTHNISDGARSNYKQKIDELKKEAGYE